MPRSSEAPLNGNILKDQDWANKKATALNYLHVAYEKRLILDCFSSVMLLLVVLDENANITPCCNLI